MKHIKVQFIIIIGIFINFHAQAQLNIGGKPYSFSHENISRNIEVKRFPQLDMQLIQEEDKRDEANGLPPRFGYPFEVNYTLFNSGTWQELEVVVTQEQQTDMRCITKGLMLCLKINHTR